LVETVAQCAGAGAVVVASAAQPCPGWCVGRLPERDWVKASPTRDMVQLRNLSECILLVGRRSGGRVLR
jgi:hypothetical protein